MFIVYRIMKINVPNVDIYLYCDFDLMLTGSAVVFITFIAVICPMFTVILIINNFVFLKKCFELMFKRCIVYISLIIDMTSIV